MFGFFLSFSLLVFFILVSQSRPSNRISPAFLSQSKLLDAARMLWRPTIVCCLLHNQLVLFSIIFYRYILFWDCYCTISHQISIIVGVWKHFWELFFVSKWKRGVECHELSGCLQSCLRFEFQKIKKAKGVKMVLIAEKKDGLDCT